jgi:sodium-dependent dicarboxylate transporter 2/3/5
MAKGSKESGLDIWLGREMTMLSVLPPDVLVFVLSTVCIVLTQLISNSATAAILLPVIPSLVSSSKN